MRLAGWGLAVVHSLFVTVRGERVGGVGEWRKPSAVSWYIGRLLGLYVCGLVDW